MPEDRSLTEVLDAHSNQSLDGLHVSCAAIVEKYDEDKQVADVKPIVRRAKIGPDGKKFYESHPVIPDVPIQWLRVAEFGIHWTLAKGDYVTLVFQDLSNSEFRTTGNESEPFDLRLHGFGSPVAYPGEIRDGKVYATLASGNKSRIGKDSTDIQLEFDVASGKLGVGRGATNPISRGNETQDYLDKLKAVVDAMNVLIQNLVPVTGATDPDNDNLAADKGAVQTAITALSTPPDVKATVGTVK